MANIFDKEPRDYGLIADQAGEMTDAQIIAALEADGVKMDWSYTGQPELRLKSDAEAATAAFGLVSNNLEAVTSEIEEILRERFMIPEFIPINSSIPEGAESYSLKVVNRYGKGKFINKDGSNVETATASVGKIVFNIEYAGIEPEWSLQELRNSLFTGIALDNESLEAAVQGALDHIQEVGFNGDADVGFTGLLNSADIPVYSGTVPNILTATADEIIAFIQNVISDIGIGSDEIVYQHFGSNSMYVVLPTSSFDRISTMKHGTDSDRTIAQYLQQNNPWTQRTGKPVEFKSLPRATDAAATGSGRMLVYPINRRILEMAIPIMPRIITAVNTGYTVKTPMEYSMSGVNIKRGSLARYADGVEGA